MAIKKDSMKIKEIILNFPNQFAVGVEKAKDVAFKKRIKRLVFCGMGGSALAPELLKTYFYHTNLNIPIIIHRDYNSPQNLTKEDLIFFISYSGNTEETISAFKNSLNKNFSMLTISSGGKLKELAEKNKISHVLIPSGLPPRFSLGYQLGAIIKVLSNSRLISFSFNQQLNINPLKWQKLGQKIAFSLKEKVPVIYSSFANFPLALVWKIKFNENTKIPAFCNYFPELNHNEMVGFSRFNEKFFLIFLMDKNDRKEIKKRMNLTAKILKKKNLKSIFIEMLEINPLEKIFNNILLADWVSYYLAQNYKVDPGPVKMVEEFKKLLKN